MRIGVYRPVRVSASVAHYAARIFVGLRDRGIELASVCPGAPLPREVDLYWDPFATGGRAPDCIFRDRTRPLVVTVHGMASSSLPMRDYYRGWQNVIRGRARRWIERAKWRRWHDGETIDVVTVSLFGSQEVLRHLPVKVRQITPIHHGVDREVFRPENPLGTSLPFFLHVSHYQPLKNVSRILDSFLSASLHPIRLVVVNPGLPRRLARPTPGVEWVIEEIDRERVASLMREAMAFVFPSLRESFGLPILEAMACGCPVITSWDSGCREVAADAALLVDPRSTEQIRKALQRLAREPETRRNLRQRGLARAKKFSWDESSQGHLDVFRNALSPAPRSKVVSYCISEVSSGMPDGYSDKPWPSW